MDIIKLNRVLIALDYNPSAQKVAEVGYSIAKTLGAECMLLHILSTPIIYTSVNYDPIMGFSGFEALENYQLNSELLSKSAKKYLDKVKKHLGDSNVETIVKDTFAGIECAAFALSDSQWGQSLQLAIAGDIKPEQSAINEYLTSKISRAAKVKNFIYLNELPRTSLGKVDRAKLAEIASEVNHG